MRQFFNQQLIAFAEEEMAFSWHKTAQCVNLSLSRTEQSRVVKVSLVDDVVQVWIYLGYLAQSFLYLLANVRFVLQLRYVIEWTTLWQFKIQIRVWLHAVADVFQEKHGQHIILVLTGIHAASQNAATFPKDAI